MQIKWHEQLDQIRSRVLTGGFTSSSDFFKAFEGLFDQEVRHNRCDDETVPWMALTDRHLTLIERVSELHRLEEAFENQKALRETLSVPVAMEASLDGRRGDRIYCLKAADTANDFVGDLHSDPDSLMILLRRTGFIDSALTGRAHRLIFLGDYVDRGKGHLALLSRLLALKCCFPERVFLLRGNHDGGVLEGPNQVRLPYRKLDAEPDEDYLPTYLLKLGRHFPQTKPLLEAYLDFFDTLGQLAFVKAGTRFTMAVHGGIPRPMKTPRGYFSYLTKLSDLSDRTLMDAYGRTMVQNLMWSDPYRGTGDLREGLGRFYFTEAQFEDFAQTIGIDQLLRGHEWMVEGYRMHFHRRLYTIFSSGVWPGEGSNDMTAQEQVQARWARLTADGKIEIHPKNIYNYY